MKLDTPHIFSSKHHHIELRALKYDEPNYGRFHWKYQFVINDKLVENRYMNYKYGGLYGNLANFCFESEDGKYVYLPLEKNALVFEPHAESYFVIPSTGDGGNNEFIANVFSEKDLIILCKRSIQIVNLLSKTTQTVVFSMERYQLKSIVNGNELQISYLDLNDNKTYINTYDPEIMDFRNQ